MRYRKNIDCLTTAELHDLREAFAGIYALPATDPRSFATIASFHGGPPSAYCRHGSPGFFTWHRAYLLAIDDALRSVRCDVTLPYWDWSSGPSTGLPHACHHATYVNRSGATVPNPLYSGPRPAGGQTARRPDIDTTPYDDLAASAQAALGAATFSSFQSQINGVHGSVHVRTGGDMGSVPTASYDPIFYLHHANVDRLWAQWQASHPGPLPTSEATFELAPFNRPYSNQWQRGSDVESTDALGYRYRRFCFVFPPIRLWEIVRIDWPLPVRQQVDSARLVIKSSAMHDRSLEIRAFVNQPGATTRTKTIGNPAFAGSVGFLGHPARPAVKNGELETAVHALLSRAAVSAPVAIHEHSQAAVAAEGCVTCAVLGHTREHALHHGHQHAHHGEGADHLHPPAPRGSGERFDMELDVTRALGSVPPDAREVSLKLVAVDADGNDVQPGAIRIDDIELVVD